MITDILHNFKNKLLYSPDQLSLLKRLHVRRLEEHDLSDEVSLNNLIELYRDVFGHGGTNDWGEYLVCSDCKSTYSIEDIHDVLQYTHIKDLPKFPNQSKCCGVVYEYFHTHSALVERLKAVVSDPHTDAFVLEDREAGAVVGLIIGGFMDSSKAWEESIKPKLVLPADKLSPPLPEKVLYMDEVGIIKSYRKGIVPILLLLSAFFERMQGLRSSAKEILFWTSESSKVYKLIQQLHHDVVIRDESKPTRVVVTLPISGTANRVWLLRLLYT